MDIQADHITSSILRLPDELLGNICVEAALAYLQLRWLDSTAEPAKRPKDISPSYDVFRVKYNHTAPFYGWLKITHICRRWRWIALGTPRLWAYVKLTSPDCVSTCLARSGQVPVLIFEPPRRFFRPSLLANWTLAYSLKDDLFKMLGLVWREMHRIQHLESPITGEICDVLRDTSGSSNTPQLKKLILFSCDKARNMYSIPMLSNSPVALERLQTLALHGALVNENLLTSLVRPGLTELLLDSVPHQSLPFDTCTVLLRGLPMLVNLSLACVAPAADFSLLESPKPSSSSLVPLRHLKALTLRGFMPDICVANADLLRRLDIPRNTNIFFDVSDAGDLPSDVARFIFSVLGDSVELRELDGCATAAVFCRISFRESFDHDLLHIYLSTTAPTLCPDDPLGNLDNGGLHIIFDRMEHIEGSDTIEEFFLTRSLIAGVEQLHIDTLGVVEPVAEPTLPWYHLLRAVRHVHELHLNSVFLAHHFLKSLNDEASSAAKAHIRIGSGVLPHLRTLKLENANWCAHKDKSKRRTEYEGHECGVDDPELPYTRSCYDGPLASQLLDAFSKRSILIDRSLDSLVISHPHDLSESHLLAIRSSRPMGNVVYSPREFMYKKCPQCFEISIAEGD